MAAGILIHTVVGLAPVLCFLAALLYLDSYKLVSMRSVVAVVACGLAVAGGCYFVNGLLLGWSGVELGDYARYAGPVVEELGKALVVVALIRTHRIGFLVDAAIYGFAVGAGFAILENVWYRRCCSGSSGAASGARRTGSARASTPTPRCWKRSTPAVSPTRRPAAISSR